MEIKAETFKDKFYSHIAKHIPVYAFVVLGIGGVSWGISTDVKNMEKKAALEIKMEKSFKSKVANIIKTKPYLVCGDKVYLTSEQYDITTINGKHYVVTQDTILTPLKSETINNCSIIESKTDSMVVVIPKVIPIDEQQKIIVNNLNERIVKLQNDIVSYSSQQSNYIDTLATANEKIKSLATVVKQQDNELTKMMAIEAKYKEVKTLLTIVLDKKDINLKDLVVKREEPKIVKIKVDKILKSTEEILVVSPTIPLSDIKDDKEYLQRLLFVIREIPNMHKQSDIGAQHIMRIPTNLELHAVTLTKAQLENVEHVKTQLNLAIDSMVKIYTNRFKLDRTEFRNNIRVNVGV